MDASRYNSPSRKSRFRAQGTSPQRPAAPLDEPTPGIDEEAAPYAQENTISEAGGTGVFASDSSSHEMPAEVQDGESPSAGAFLEEDNLPAGLRLTRSTERVSKHVSHRSVWPAVARSLVCLLLGGAGGYFLHTQRSAATTTAGSIAPAPGENPILPLNPLLLSEIDGSFAASKQGQFADARQRFTVLADKYPGWPSMRIEAARAALYSHDSDAAEKILTTMLRASPNADAEFLLGLLRMTMQSYDKAEAAFGRAVALDPTRPDIFYFWGECLRREGKPQDAADKFHEALVRNQYETSEGLYQLKLWMSEIQSDQESSKGSNAKIDADLASDHPSGAAIFAAAARSIKAGQFKEAGERIGQARKVMEPAVFRVILQDPIFLQENYRPELASFYKL